MASPMEEQKATHIARFYSILDRLEIALGGARLLSDCSGPIARKRVSIVAAVQCHWCDQ